MVGKEVEQRGLGFGGKDGRLRGGRESRVEVAGIESVRRTDGR
jgi:hypothetical protein